MRDLNSFLLAVPTCLLNFYESLVMNMFAFLYFALVSFIISLIFFQKRFLMGIYIRRLLFYFVVFTIYHKLSCSFQCCYDLVFCFLVILYSRRRTLLWVNCFLFCMTATLFFEIYRIFQLPADNQCSLILRQFLEIILQLVNFIS